MAIWIPARAVAAAGRSTRTIEIDEFVPRNEIDDRYIDSPYYIAPDGQVGQDAFAVIRDTIGKMNMIALGRVVLTRREHAIALETRGAARSIGHDSSISL
jgi:non-homologous end joining protein Ku